MIDDLYTPDTVIRIWLLLASIAVLATILGTHALSRALEKRVRDRFQLHPPAMPNLVPLVCQDTGTRARLAIGFTHRNSLASNALIVGAGGQDEKQTGAA